MRLAWDYNITAAGINNIKKYNLKEVLHTISIKNKIKTFTTALVIVDKKDIESAHKDLDYDGLENLNYQLNILYWDTETRPTLIESDDIAENAKLYMISVCFSQSEQSISYNYNKQSE